MQIQLLKVKIQELTVTESSIDYPGSIALPLELMQTSGIKPFELVHVNNKINGNRITTYAVVSKHKGLVTVNGAASKLFAKGDAIHVLAYCYVTEIEANTFVPTIVTTDAYNNLIESKPYTFE